MNDLINVEIHIYFKVIDADMLGGKGSEGYLEEHFSGIKNIDLEKFDISPLISDIAKGLNVPDENVIQISKEEYDYNTEDEDPEGSEEE